ncbi:MAG: histidine phosphatase family protein [Pseudomonadota bacterium]
MTRRLIVMRHAKSSWNSPAPRDHDRPLNKRGRASAPAIAAWLTRNQWLPDEVLCSSALRTQETWQRTGLSAAKTRIIPALYHAEAEVMLDILSEATGATVLMLGHNPGIADFADQIAAQTPQHSRFFDYPTGATTVLEFDIADWSDIRWHSGQVLGFAIPRELLPE